MAQPWYKKAAVQAALVSFVGLVVVTIIGLKWKRTSESSHSVNPPIQNSPHAVVQNMENSPGSIQAVGNVLVHPAELPETDLKRQIREQLGKINPEILKRIDNGEAQIPVLINVAKLQLLFQLANHPAFSKFLRLQGTGAQFRGVNRGGTVRIGNHINDIDQNGTLDGYILLIGKALKE